MLELHPGDEHVISTMNLNGFMKWAAQAAEEELDRVMAAVTITCHRGPEWLTIEAEPPLKIVRADLGRSWYMCEKMCDVPKCGRCNGDNVGWHFTWVGPWTCPTIVGDEFMTTEEILARGQACKCPRH